MKDTQCISDYLIHFNSLAVRCLWEDSMLRYRFYEGLPTQLKDKICKGDRKPNTLPELKKKAQNIDTQYWEHVQDVLGSKTIAPTLIRNPLLPTLPTLLPALLNQLPLPLDQLHNPLDQNLGSRRKLQNPSQLNWTSPGSWTLLGN